MTPGNSPHCQPRAHRDNCSHSDPHPQAAHSCPKSLPYAAVSQAGSQGAIMPALGSPKSVPAWFWADLVHKVRDQSWGMLTMPPGRCHPALSICSHMLGPGHKDGAEPTSPSPSVSPEPSLAQRGWALEAVRFCSSGLCTQLGVQVQGSRCQWGLSGPGSSQGQSQLVQLDVAVTH